MPSWLLRCRRWLALLVTMVSSWEATRTSACDSPTCCCRRPDAVTCVRREAWHIADSPNFQVCSLQSDAEARRVASQCECLRNALAKSWNPTAEPWNPRCQIVLHAEIASYVRAVGGGSQSTVGSSLVTPVRGPIRTRRIDLRTDVEDVLIAALPHELCHVVLADRFRESPAPLWFDEGVALLYDPAAKRSLHERDLHAGRQRGVSVPLRDLLTQANYPPAERWGVFYGQSGSLVRCLLTKGKPEQLIKFVEGSRDVGVDWALRETYQFANINDLSEVWKRETVNLSAELPAELALPSAMAPQLAIR
jgi:hypothetical protein